MVGMMWLVGATEGEVGVAGNEGAWLLFPLLATVGAGLLMAEDGDAVGGAVGTAEGDSEGLFAVVDEAEGDLDGNEGGELL